ncbi:O-antigen ligase family protein [Calidifontimicrobium sp. SYSU G02091]|uniref:O-antigen ligase family protein n=1 Tax=Calidifontimicrobium sp. SYSU G02091 TaxID=2926421 RepID=UPI001F53BDFF|nr:O-antigen ligase family protein [Calidifontimicrobium sp. SYSU G02091]MCI1193149.1 O-antigen ligase family protein [Calidifontimicrobium sp. SYSU G02091]
MANEERRSDGGFRVMRVLFLIASVSAALMPSVPELTDPRAFIFLGTTGLLLLMWFAARMLSGRVPRSLAAASLMCFLMWVGLSAFTAFLFDTDFNLWWRGTIPFWFLAVFFPAYDLAREDPEWIIRVLGASAGVWLLHTFVSSVGAVSQVLSGEVQRITHATEAWAAFQLPYAMIGLAVTLFRPLTHAPWIRWPMAIGFTIMPLLAVSRGQITAVAGLWLAYVTLQPRRLRSRSIAIFLVFLAGIVGLLMSSELGPLVLQRFSDTDHSESSRAAELRYALAQFSQSPLVGKGLGHQIPAEITFLGDWNVIMDAGVDSVGYMHNVVGYLLMNLGLLGFLSYGGFVFAGFRGGWIARRSTDRRLLAATLLSLACLLWWFMFQAAFRLVQCNLLLATLVAVLAAVAQRKGSFVISCGTQHSQCSPGC